MKLLNKTPADTNIRTYCQHIISFCRHLIKFDAGPAKISNFAGTKRHDAVVSSSTFRNKTVVSLCILSDLYGKQSMAERIDTM